VKVSTTLLLHSSAFLAGIYQIEAQQIDLSVSEPYLGQSLPGKTPVKFAPGIVSTDHLEIEGVFGPRMDEFYFTRQVIGEPVQVHMLQENDGVWTETVMGPRPDGEVFISTDGHRMYQGNKYRERTKSGWSEPVSVGPAFDEFPVMRLTKSDLGTYVFDERDEVGTIRYSRLVDGERQPPLPLGPEINSGRYTAHPFIAPDESYVIWDSEREDGYGDSDLYISFSQSDGTWGPAINLGPEINSELEDAYGSVTPDGLFFFFQRIDLSVPVADIFWVDASFIDDLRRQQ